MPPGSTYVSLPSILRHSRTSHLRYLRGVSESAKSTLPLSYLARTQMLLKTTAH
jgi:hypothetical protein